MSFLECIIYFSKYASLTQAASVRAHTLVSILSSYTTTKKLVTTTTIYYHVFLALFKLAFLVKLNRVFDIQEEKEEIVD